jgi:hypothetical protein
LLEAYFKGAKCVVVMARQLTEGVRVELDTLVKHEAAPLVIAGSWSEAVQSHETRTPSVELRLAHWCNADVLPPARCLRGWVWLAVLLP